MSAPDAREEREPPLDRGSSAQCEESVGEGETGEAASRMDAHSLDGLFAALARPLGVRSLPLSGLFLIATFFTLYFARSLFLPLFFAVLAKFLAEPVVDALERWRLPRPLGAAVVLVTAFVTMSLLAYSVARPASVWVERLPSSLVAVRDQLAFVRHRVEDINEATKRVKELADVGKEDAIVVELKEPVLDNPIFSQTPDAFARIGVALVFLYFLLAAGDDFLRKLVEIVPRLRDKKRLVSTVRQIEADISSYLFTISLVNAVFGCILAGVFALLGLSNAALWGLVATSLKFFPYVGTATGFVLFFLVGAMEYEALEYALIPASLFLGLSLLETFVITPRILGSRLTLSATAIFLSLVFWSWLWGIPGAILSVPLLTVFKITCDRLPSMQAVGTLLGERKVPATFGTAVAPTVELG